jgi:hypothetical protein
MFDCSSGCIIDTNVGLSEKLHFELILNLRVLKILDNILLT